MRVRPILLCLLLAGAPAGADTPPVRVAPARWEGAGLVLEVSVGAPADLAARTMPAPLHYAIGVAAMPLAALDPAVALGWPVYLLLGAPWQARFNQRSVSVAHALAEPGLPRAVADALAAQWQAVPQAGAPALQLRIDSYGLVTRSGRALEAFEPQEDLCLAASAQWQLERDGTAAAAGSLVLTPARREPEAPPPICLPLARWAEDGGRATRAGVAELGEVLAALLLRRLGQAR